MAKKPETKMVWVKTKHGYVLKRVSAKKRKTDPASSRGRSQGRGPL